jgi:hypothetical protein
MEIHGPKQDALGTFDLTGQLDGVVEAWPIEPKEILSESK